MKLIVIGGEGEGERIRYSVMYCSSEVKSHILVMWGQASCYKAREVIGYRRKKNWESAKLSKSHLLSH